MAHPYHHSLSSARNNELNKGETAEGTHKTVDWETHFPIHDWLDSSKFSFADARHRSLFHNPSGVKIASKIFRRIPKAKEIATQHIIEDMGQVYDICQWLPLEYFPKQTNNNELLVINKDLSLTDLKGSLIFNNPFPKYIQREITTGIDILLSPDTTETNKLDKKDPRRLFFFCSAGPYIIEKLLGPTLGQKTKSTTTKTKAEAETKTTEKPLATRSVFEFFIQKAWGFIPSHQDLMSNRPIEDWMWRKAKPLSKEL